MIAVTRVGTARISNQWVFCMRRALGLVMAAVSLWALPMQGESGMAKLTGIIDGGTMTVTFRGQDLKVRMHGIAIPPADEERPILRQLNDESLAFVRKYLEGDAYVYLEFPGGKPSQGSDGSIPAYVYRGKDASFLNEKLVGLGLAVVNRKEKNDFTAQWLKVQEKARESQRGVWGSFVDGSGEDLASGVAQRQYIGASGAGGSRGGYITGWIIIY